MHSGNLILLASSGVLGLSWLAGLSLVRAVVPARGDGALALHAGYGYFIGLLVTAFLMTLFAQFGMDVDAVFGPTVAGLLLIAGAAFLVARVRGRGPSDDTGLGAWLRCAPSWQAVLFMCLVAWVAVRLGMIGLEAGLRPLFPWDAWMHWSPKARVWIETGEWLPFGSRSDWLADGERLIYTIRNWSYPAFVPLIQTWTLMPLGGWHETAFGLSWVLATPALLCAVYGTSRGLGFDPLAAMIACWLMISLPFLHVHAALPGYADLWLGCYAALAAGAFLMAMRRPRFDWLLIGAVVLATCLWIKNPGLAWLVVLSCGLLGWFAGTRHLLWLSLAGPISLAVLVLIGIDIQLPVLGRVALGLEGFDLPLIGPYEWQFNRVGSVMLEHLFLHPEWHLLWWGLGLAWVNGLVNGSGDRAALSAVLMMGLGMVFLTVAFLFTSRGGDLASTRLTHRAFLPLAMIGIMCLPALLTFRPGRPAPGSPISRSSGSAHATVPRESVSS